MSRVCSSTLADHAGLTLADFGIPPKTALSNERPNADPAWRCAPIAGRPMEIATMQQDPLPNRPPRYLRTPEAARFLGLSGRTLEKHRTFGSGPAYRKIGGRVVYRLEDLQLWAEASARQSTSDPGTSVARRPGRPAKLVSR